jgi:hypothetical protein
MLLTFVFAGKDLEVTGDSIFSKMVLDPSVSGDDLLPK